MQLDSSILSARTHQFWENCSQTHVADAKYYERVRSVLPLICELHLGRTFKVLDVGCGNGELTELAAAHCHHVDAFDISPALIQAATARGVSNIRYEVHGVDDISRLADQRYDAILVMGVFVTLHGDAFASAVDGLSRLLKPRGVMVARDSLSANGTDLVRQVVGDYHAHYRSGDSYVETFSRHGLTMRRAVYLDSFPGLENYFFVFEKGSASGDDLAVQ